MRNTKRLLYYLLINILVSACTTLIVLFVWDRTQAPTPILTRRTPAPVAEVTSNPPVPLEAAPTSASANATATPTQIQNVQEYQVKFGDSLGSISLEFDVSIEELLALNQIPDPNSLPVGMVMYIPVEPEATATSALPTPTHTNIPGSPVPTTGSQVQAGVRINGVIGIGNLTSEHVFITRTGDGELSLAGWQLSDEDGNVYIFPQLILYKDGGVNVWTSSGSPTVVDLYWGLGSPVWEPGERVVLRDSQGSERATFTIP